MHGLFIPVHLLFLSRLPNPCRGPPSPTFQPTVFVVNANGLYDKSRHAFTSITTCIHGSGKILAIID